MPATYEPIATTNLTSAAASITFSSIPQTYTDMRLVLTSISASPGPNSIQIVINGLTTSIYSAFQLGAIGAGGTFASNFSSGTYLPTTLSFDTGDTGPKFLSADFLNYSGSNSKVILMRNSYAQATSSIPGSGVGLTAGMTTSTSAITSFVINSVNYNFAVGTQATIYGIKAA
jgi:hypothetical protein